MKRAKRDLKVEIFTSFEDANKADYSRWAKMSPKQRWDELAVLQRRVFGPGWTRRKMKKIASFEKLAWA